MIKAIDFFCGAGGLTRGLLDSGIEVILGIDADGRCRETYENNNPPAKMMHCDIRELAVTDLQKILSRIPKEKLMFAACAPCQPYSKQRTVPKDKHQRALLGYFKKFVEAFEPYYIFVENVPGIAKIPGNYIYQDFVTSLSIMGYFIEAADVDAKNYGVPQTRRRRILLASKLAPIKIPKATHGPNKLPYVTVRATISKFPAIKAGEDHPGIPNHRASLLSDLNLIRIKHTPINGGDRKHWPENLILDCHKNNYNGHTDVYGRMWWERPAPALTCKCHSLSNGRYGHPEQDRAISLREAAALQTFPDHYIFYGNSKAVIGNQIGNAVPVRLAKIIGAEFLRCASTTI